MTRNGCCAFSCWKKRCTKWCTRRPTGRNGWALRCRGFWICWARGAAGTRSQHQKPFGAEIVPDGVRFRLWAPSQSEVSLQLEGATEGLPMEPLEGGWHELTTPRAHAGSLYRYRFPDGTAVPDPASRFQPEDVHGPSRGDRSERYLWQDRDWPGRPWQEAVVYELHVGAFTPEGTFRAAIDKLDHLRDSA